nr:MULTISPECIES: hypothetical protein [Enterobacteriaceae]
MSAWPDLLTESVQKEKRCRYSVASSSEQRGYLTKSISGIP